ncbi:MAG TPA: PLP-dependent aspartate aminotransferase family protein [Longimicrobiaceae bacterium]|nr:PLP-dependent aspartate aminotransferase family protein [Longimicrobiaceae bacterium]
MSQDLRSAGLSTRAVHAGDPARAVDAPVNTPIVQSSTFYSDPDGAGELLYSRYGNGPNNVAVEARIAALEGAEDCVAVGSGMAAVACALLACARAGDHVLAAEALYGGTRTLLARELSRLGVESTFVDFFADGWRDALRPDTRVLLVETVSNPLLRVPDLRPLAEAAHAAGAVLVVDSTFATPVNARPLESGADLVVHSATKYLGGHSDLTAGAVLGGGELLDAVRARAQVWGPALDPHAAWLLERGIKTLPLRMERHNRNGLEVARRVEGLPGVARVHYPGLPSHPDHEVARRVLCGFGGLVGIEVEGGAGSAARFLRALRLAKAAPSLGGVETLVSEPRHTSHAAFTPAEREALGIRDGFFRFSVGIEDADDIVADVEQALEAVNGA